MKKAIEQAFLNAYETHADALFRYCFFRVFDRGAAEDLVQETYLKAWNYLAQGHQVLALKPFLYQVAKNLMIDASRKRKIEPSVEELVEVGKEPAGDNAHTIVTEIETHDVIEKLRGLPDADQELILLRFVEGYKPKEIAQMLEETPNVISVRLHRAKHALKKLCSGTP